MKKAFKIFAIFPILVVMSGLFYYYNNRLFLWEAQILWPQAFCATIFIEIFPLQLMRAFEPTLLYP
jgi:hypothetical protein